MGMELEVLMATAAGIAFMHTVLGPDHYVPFIGMARAGRWSTGKTVWITVLCGIGHVGSSVVLGGIGIAAGYSLSSVTSLESLRATIAAWALISFGLVYMVWGIRRAVRGVRHEHWHTHENEIPHLHAHAHIKNHLHVHGAEHESSLTPWILFTIFVFGPCEPLIPILMYPAATRNVAATVWVVGLFGVVTILTMLGVVWLGVRGARALISSRIELYSHAIAGAMILLCGLAVEFLGV